MLGRLQHLLQRVALVSDMAIRQRDLMGDQIGRVRIGRDRINCNSTRSTPET